MPYACVATVAVENTNFGFDTAFSYLVPAVFSSDICPGKRVLVPFGKGNKKRQGFVFSVKNISGDDLGHSKLKSISAVLDTAPLLNNELLDLALFLKERTFCTLFEAAKSMIPSSLMLKVATTYIVSPSFDEKALNDLSDDERQVIEFLLPKEKYVKKDVILSKLGFSQESNVCELLQKKSFLIANYEASRKLGDATVRNVSICMNEDELTEILPQLTAKQKNVVELLIQIGTATVKEVCYFTGITPAVIEALRNKGIVEVINSTILRNPLPEKYDSDTTPIVLTREQNVAYEILHNKLYENSSSATLLYGVTGSGKTNVYMKLIDDIVPMDKGIILMVPEISLTPQTLSLFLTRYGKNIAVFHSGLSLGERLDEWKRVKSGEAKIVIGTRSAVFAPLENIALIVIDEEQEHTYKSEMTPRYHARDIAKFRCSFHNAMLLLVSATPSIETYSAALEGRYALCELSERYGTAKLPEVITVDISSDDNLEDDCVAISKALSRELTETLKKKEQSILLINRRGFNTFVACVSCKHVITCPNCSISLTYHSANNRLMCHYCGYSEAFTEECPNCYEKNIRYSGFGTQRVENELSRILPSAKILRMDTDTTMSKDSHKQKLTAFANGEYDIMLGTQMVAKGLDFSNVTLVGVVSIDQQLYNDDYKSLERSFDLLTQVVGRAGRGEKKGKAIIQTLMPENDIICLAADQNYKEFYKTEILIRKSMIYPPYCDLCCIGFIGTDEINVRSASNQFLIDLKKLNKSTYDDLKLIVLGPLPPKVSKVSNKYRFRIIIKCKNSKRLRNFISQLLISFSKNSKYNKVSVFADMNPQSMFN